MTPWMAACVTLIIVFQLASIAVTVWIGHLMSGLETQLVDAKRRASEAEAALAVLRKIDVARPSKGEAR